MAKTLQSVIDARKANLTKYESDKQAMLKKRADFIQEVKDTVVVDMTIPASFLETVKEYVDKKEAVELRDHEAYHKKGEDKISKEKVAQLKSEMYTQLELHKTAPITQADVEYFKPLFDSMAARMAKQAQNYDIQIKDATRDILLYELIVQTQGLEEHPAGYQDFVEKLLTEPEKKEKFVDYGFIPEAGWTLDKLEKACVDAKGTADWGIIGKCIKQYNLKPGAGGKLVAC